MSATSGNDVGIGFALAQIQPPADITKLWEPNMSEGTMKLLVSSYQEMYIEYKQACADCCTAAFAGTGSVSASSSLSGSSVRRWNKRQRSERLASAAGSCTGMVKPVGFAGSVLKSVGSCDSLTGVSSASSYRGLLRAADTSGMCYKRLLVRGDFGTWPALSQLLALPSADLVSNEELATLQFQRVAGGDLHVTSGVVGPSALDALAAVVQSGVVGVHHSLVDRLKGVEVSSVLRQFPLKLTDRVGGDDSVGLSCGQWLAGMAGRSEHRFRDADMDILTKGMALLDASDKARARVIQVVGDSAVTLALSSRCLRDGMTVEQFQNARSSLTSTANLSRLFVQVVPQRWFSVPGGVKAGEGRVGASFFEGLLGLVYEDLGIDAVTRVLVKVGLLGDD